MCIAIQNIVTLAKHTFQRKTAPNGSKQRLIECEEFLQRLKEMSEVMKHLDVEDLGLDQSPSLFPEKFSAQSFSDSKYSENQANPHIEECNTDNGDASKLNPERGDKAPVTYISVHEDCDFSISIFIIHGHSRIPLHNHPDMHGLLQVVHGSLEVSCYNKIPLSELTSDDLPEALRNKQHLVEKGYIVPAETIMLRAPTDKNSGPLLLEPDKDNYHEIWNAGDKPAVFLDILAPPYTNQEESEDTNTDQPSNKEQRHCDFYKIARPMHRAPNPDKISHNLSPGRDEVEKKCFWLQVVPTPSDYNCDFEPYLGPTLVLPP